MKTYELVEVSYVGEILLTVTHNPTFEELTAAIRGEFPSMQLHQAGYRVRLDKLPNKDLAYLWILKWLCDHDFEPFGTIGSHHYAFRCEIEQS